MAGMSCSACHENILSEMLSDPDLDIPSCTELQDVVYGEGRNPIKTSPIIDPLDTQTDTFWGEKTCSHPYMQTCVGYEEICKAYCPGGVIQPISKPYFYTQGYQRTGKVSPIDIYTSGPREGEY